ncbi:MAG: sporulation peptidase YabG [Desulforudis sp.]|jgi:spore coat assembly protein|nr:sporulation peptidase YabG [Clostridia bacterium]MDQ7791844.1 sporulation peptidase YabG [Clostridia bacterium]RJX22083.1 MAG: sporulation peptidase YabG [Desulforudis sp.]
MALIEAGDIVGRKSYNRDLYFKVCELYNDPDGRPMAKLYGLDVRLCADAPVEDLEKISSEKVAEHWRKVMMKSGELIKRSFARRDQDQASIHSRNSEEIKTFNLPGRVLHMDGDPDYLDLCVATYKQLGVTCHAYHIAEKKQPGEVGQLLQKHNPDILVATGHDSFLKGKKNFKSLDNYRNSCYFVETVQAARRFEKSRDDLVIFAGACQSHYEAILEAGANFASSPERVLIHAFDPVFVVERVAYTPVHLPVELRETIEATITGYPGIGGVDTPGKFRLGAPKSAY